MQWINVHLEILKFLVHIGANLNAKDSLDRTPLHIASSIRGQLSIVKFLVGKEVDLDARDYDSRTPLHHAAENGKLEIVKYLIYKGARLNAADVFGQTPLHRASGYGGHLNVAMFLVDRDGDLQCSRQRWPDTITSCSVSRKLTYR